MPKSHWYTLNHRARKQSAWLENDEVAQTHMKELLKLLGIDKPPSNVTVRGLLKNQKTGEYEMLYEDHSASLPFSIIWNRTEVSMKDNGRSRFYRVSLMTTNTYGNWCNNLNTRILIGLQNGASAFVCQYGKILEGCNIDISLHGEHLIPLQKSVTDWASKYVVPLTDKGKATSV
jgi:hypothetical protein